MKHALNFLLILATILNPLVSIQSSVSVPLQPQAQVAATATPQSGMNAAYPAPATPTPPAPASRISLKTNLNCVSPEQDLSLDWDFQPAPEWAGRESALELVVALPPAFTPDSKGWTRFDAQSGVGRQPLSKTGKLQGKLAKEISGALKIGAKVVNGENVLAETTLQLTQGSLFDLPVKGGQAASPSRRFKVTIPEGALDEGVSLCLAKSANAGGGEPFSVTAEGKGSKSAVRSFKKNIQLSYQLTPGEFGGDEANLSFVYFDEAKQNWQYLPSEVDLVNHVVIGYSDHLTEFNVNINAVDQYKINDLSAFNVAEFMGSGTYSMGLKTPPGPGGFAPSLNLSYSSSISDAAGFQTQGSWVGLGWNLEVGAVVRNTHGTHGINDDTFSLMLGGQSLSLQPYRRGTDTTVGSDTLGKTYVEYQGQNTNFWQIRRYIQYNGTNAACSGRDCTDTSFWKVWDQAGNVYKFDERQVYLSSKEDYVRNNRDNYKWLLTSARNPVGQEISFDYEKTTVSRYGPDGKWYSDDDVEVILHQIRYANNRYWIHFKTSARNDWTDTCLGAYAACTIDRKKLSEVQIYYNPNGQAMTYDSADDPNLAGIEQIRRYQFNYFSDSTSPLYPYMTWTHDGVTGHTLALSGVKEFGTGSSSLPETTFTYDAMHLTDVNNGYNGKVHLVYETDPWPTEGVANGVVEGQGRVYRWFGDTQSLAALYSDPWWTEVMPTCCSGHFNRIAPIAPGKMMWMRLSTHTDQGNRNLSFSIQNNDTFGVIGKTINNVNGEWAVVLKMPQNINGRIYFNFQASSDIEVWNEVIGTAVTRYRVKERWVYRDTASAAHDVYKYDYTENGVDTASTNTPALSDLSTADFVEDKVSSKPYTEFRGHGTVTVSNEQDGSKTVTHYYQKDGLVGQVKDSTLYRKDVDPVNGVHYHKVSATIMGDGIAGSDYYKQIIQRPSPDTLVDNPNTPENETAYTYCGQGATTGLCKDNTIYWTSPKLVEKRTYTSDSGNEYVATRTAYNYVLSALSTANPPTLPPVYELRSVVESEGSHSNNWTVQRKQLSTYTATDVATDVRYFVGHPSSTAVCSANGSEAYPEYQICGTNAGAYYGFTSYTYNTLGQVSEVVNLLNFTGAPSTSYTNRYSDYTQYTYDSYGNVVTTGKGYKDQNVAGVVQQTTTLCYRAETSGQTPACVDYTGAGVNGVYLSWVKNALNQVTHYRSSPQLGLPTQQIDPNGAVISVSYDEFGRIVAARKPGDIEPGLATFQFAYNPPTTSIPYFWTEATQKLDETQTLKVRKFYNGTGELIQTQQVGVKVSDTECSAPTCTVVINQKSEYVNGVKTTTQAVPYAAATPVQAGYIALPASPWQNATVTTYDILGRPLAIKAPGQTEANKQSFSYGVDGNPLKTKTTDANGHTTESWKDVWGRTVKVQPQIGPWLEYGYDVANRLTTVKQFPQGSSAEFATTTIEYDVAGRKLNMTDPDMGKWYYTYDALSNLTRQKDAKGQRICLYYDALNRLTDKYYPVINSECPVDKPAAQYLNVRYSYDANTWGKGRRTGMSDASGSTSWSYDARGRMTSETKTVKDGATVLGTYVTSWTYTSADRIATMTYPSGEVVTSNYLPQGTLTSLTSSYNLTYLSSASVDAAGRPTVFNLGNGTQTVYTYNGWAETDGQQSGRLKKLQSGSPESITAGAPSLQSFEYTYNWVGNITKIIQRLAGSTSDETLNYGYDEINRLTSETNNSVNPALIVNSAYSADTGNLTSKGGPALGYGAQAANCPPVLPGTPPKVHAATSRGSDTYCYDENGNMTRRTLSTNTYTLSYDPENRLSEINYIEVVSNLPVAMKYVYVYDGDGQRVLVKQTTIGGQIDQTIYIGGHFEVFIKAGYTPPAAPPARNCGGMRCIFLPSVTALITSPAPAGHAWKSYYSTGSGRVLRVKDNTNTGGSSGIFWLYADHLGSTTVTARMDAIGGDLLSTLSYTAWGETRASSGTTPTSLRYTGQREAEAGLYFYQARWYDPALGRFAQADSVIPEPGKSMSWDRFAYVNNNPVNANDPSGHFACGDGIDDPRCGQYEPKINDPVDSNFPNDPYYDPEYSAWRELRLGSPCTACHVTHGIGHIPNNSELDPELVKYYRSLDPLAKFVHIAGLQSVLNMIALAPIEEMDLVSNAPTINNQKFSLSSKSEYITRPGPGKQGFARYDTVTNKIVYRVDLTGSADAGVATPQLALSSI